MTQTNPQVKSALLGELGVTPSRLSQLVKARKRELPMDTPMAVYTLAHENGIDVSKYLETKETSEVRTLVATLRSGARIEPAATAKAGAPTRSARRRPKDVQVSISGVDIGKVPGLKAAHAKEAKRMAEQVYPTLYIFENSVRDLIERVLRAKHGSDWWASVPKKVREKAKQREAAEGDDPWHGARGARPIDYVDLVDLWSIINSAWDDFAPLFKPGKAWVESLITNDMNVSRRPLAHMNPLDPDDVSNIQASFRKWVKLLSAIEAELP